MTIILRIRSCELIIVLQSCESQLLYISKAFHLLCRILQPFASSTELKTGSSMTSIMLLSMQWRTKRLMEGLVGNQESFLWITLHQTSD